MVKNEQDIIEPFLRHNHNFFDAMVVLENRSSDDTKEILLKCARELGNIIVTDLPDFEYYQSEFMSSALYHVQAAFFADFICFLDVDEFIASESRQEFETSISMIPAGSAASLPWKTFLPHPKGKHKNDADPLKNMNWRRVLEQPQFSKVFIRLGGGVDPAITMDMGNHGAKLLGKRKMPSSQIENLSLMHFPVRSSDQILAKGVVGRMALQARDQKHSNKQEAIQWKQMSDLAYEKDFKVDAEKLTEAAMNYAQTTVSSRWKNNAVQENHGINLERKHSDGSSANIEDMIAAVHTTPDINTRKDHLLSSKNQNETVLVENAFTNDWHANNPFLDIPPFLYIAEKYQPKSVFDVGCGSGVYLRLFKQNGAKDIFGVDGIENNSTVLDKDEYSQIDLHNPYDAGRKFDLVMCLEVIEHLNPEATEIAIDTIAKHASDLLVFSIAEPDQPGIDHINCMEMPKVLELWRNRGWQPDLVDTLGIRALSSFSWFRRNLLVLKKSETDTANRATRIISGISKLGYNWYSQDAKVITAAFKEPAPTLPYGYGIVDGYV